MLFCREEVVFLENNQSQVVERLKWLYSDEGIISRERFESYKKQYGELYKLTQKKKRIDI
jgi:hypothetical protein